jgi:hypothetical protein
MIHRVVIRRSAAWHPFVPGWIAGDDILELPAMPRVGEEIWEHGDHLVVLKVVHMPSRLPMLCVSPVPADTTSPESREHPSARPLPPSN